MSICGDPIVAGEATIRLPCLPPAPASLCRRRRCAIAPVAFAVAPTLYAAGDAPLAGPPLIALAQPRAPPFA